MNRIEACASWVNPQDATEKFEVFGEANTVANALFALAQEVADAGRDQVLPQGIPTITIREV